MCRVEGLDGADTRIPVSSSVARLFDAEMDAESADERRRRMRRCW